MKDQREHLNEKPTVTLKDAALVKPDPWTEMNPNLGTNLKPVS